MHAARVRGACNERDTLQSGAKGLELLEERWTMLRMREILLGTEHLNGSRRGLPRISPTLPSRRSAALTIHT